MRQQIINRPVKLSELSFDDLYEQISNNWRDKANRLQARRWRALERKARLIETPNRNYQSQRYTSFVE